MAVRYADCLLYNKFGFAFWNARNYIINNSNILNIISIDLLLANVLAFLLQYKNSIFVTIVGNKQISVIILEISRMAKVSVTSIGNYQEIFQIEIEFFSDHLYI